MKGISLGDLQESVQDKTAFSNLDDYHVLCRSFIEYAYKKKPTRIISPSHSNYIFYQFNETYQNKITRPLNSDLFMESVKEFDTNFDNFIQFLKDLKTFKSEITSQDDAKKFLDLNGINKVIYTIQQSIGAVGDSFENPNQCRKRIGQLFERLVTLILQNVGVKCESRTIKIPIPNHQDYMLSYELDLVFSRNKAIIPSETRFIHPLEVAGSVKTTSKDRIDKLFLDKYLLTKLIGRDIPFVAIFLHDVQRARRGTSIFGINSTFKTNHFLGYTVALNRLDGVYYVDPRPEMHSNKLLREQIQDFQRFLVKDLWDLTPE